MNYDPTIIFDIKSKVPSTDTGDYQNSSENSDIHGNFLCLLFKNNRIGAAHYSFQDKTLNIYEEMSDISPKYLMTATVYREVAPKYLLTFGNVTDEYVKALIDMVGFGRDSRSIDSLRLPENFFLMSLKEYPYEVCHTIISNIKIASYKVETADVTKEIYIHSWIDMSHKLSIQALAALYKYLEKNWSSLGFLPGDIHFLHINQKTLKNHVLLDNSSFKALQIFSKRSHEAGFKRGDESSSREGLSIYKLFISACKSKIGQVRLRNILTSPINDENELNKRLNFISFVLDPVNNEIIENVQNNLKHLRDVTILGTILEKILNGRATNKDWDTIYKIIYHTIFINDMTKVYRNQNILFIELNSLVTENLLGLQESISSALDFNAGVKRGRPVIKFGLDEDLDAKLLRRQDIATHLTAAAHYAINDLPEFIDECKVIYLPEMGHLLAIKEWEPNCNTDVLQYLGYQLMFVLGGIIHYKTPLCVDLDKRLGDINADIIDHENRILRRLSAFMLKYNNDIREPLKILGLIDCLIAMARIAQQFNYTKPNFNKSSVHEITDSRHPLMEQILNNFEANHFYSGGHNSCIKIITGANGSGKSVFLKQIALVIYLAHIGSYVPAQFANIGLTNSIHCTMRATDSAVLRMSSFMIDIAQTTQALHYAGKNSLILLDEFGRGTLDDDGVILLASIVKAFLEQKDKCPHILISTHLQRIHSFLPESKYLEYLKMDHVVQDGTFCFLHKLTKGISESYALEIASTILDEDIMSKARYYFECINSNQVIPLPDESSQLERLNEINIPELDE